MKRRFNFFTMVMVVGFLCTFFSNVWAEEINQRININTATVEQLMDLKGVGEKLAQRIVDYRTQNGPFSKVDDLNNVKGIGPKILTDNAEVITVGENDPSANKSKGVSLDKPTKAN